MPIGIKNLPPDGYSSRESSEAINQINQLSLSFGGSVRPAGQQYYQNEIIYDPPWTMVAIRDTTDRPSPQPTGPIIWASQLGDTPAWTVNNNPNADLITAGQRYHFTFPIVISKGRFWVEEITPQTYAVLRIEDPLGDPITEVFVPQADFPTTGWKEVTLGQNLVIPPQTFDLLLLADSTAIPISDNGVWVYKQTNGNPSSGEINHQNGGAEMRVHKTDKDGTPHNAFLEAMSQGDNISGGGIIWTITTVTDNGAHMRYGVSPATRAQEGDLTMTFDQEQPASIDYVSVNNLWAAEPNVDGYLAVDVISPGALNDNQYGVDIEIQNMTASPDWEVLAYNG